MDLKFRIDVDTKPTADFLPELRQAREQSPLCPLGPGSAKHLLPVGEAGVGCYESIERIRRHVILAFDTACLKECASRLKIRILSNEVIGQ